MNTNFLICLLAIFVIAGDLFAQSTKQKLQEAEKLHDQADQLNQQGNYNKALVLFERSLAIKQKALGPDHPDTAKSLNELGACYESIGDYAKALSNYEQALAIREKALGPESPFTAASIHNLGNLYKLFGKYDQALTLYKRSVEICEKSLGPQHPFTAMTINSLAKLYRILGDIDKAVMLSKRSVEICEKSLGPQHIETADMLASLSITYYYIGDYSNSLRCQERAFNIREKTLGPTHTITAESLRSIADIYSSIGETSKAQHFYERALIIQEKTIGNQHIETGNTLNNLAKALFSAGYYSQALPLYERALAITEKNLGPQHRYTAKVLNNLSELCYLIGDLPSARNYASRQVAAKQREMQSILLLDEHERLVWQKENLDFWIACILRPESLAQIALRWKSVVLDSLLEDRSLAISAKHDPDGLQKLQEISNLQAKLAQIAFKKDKESEAEDLQYKISELQRSLATRSNILGRVRMSADLTIDSVTSSFSSDAALVDLIRFFDPRAQGEASWCYGAIITAPDGSSDFVRIDGASGVDSAVESLRAAINQGNAAEVEAQTKFLSEKLWQPVAAKIPEGTKRLFVCPDAGLNFLAFSALLESDGRFVAEKYPISYIGSARDLAKKPSEKISKNMAIFANPQFDATGKNSKTTEMLGMRSAEADVFGSIALPPLPGTETEAQSLGSLATESGWNVNSVLGKDATESSVRNTQKPGILHLATHGFYLNSLTPPAPEGSRGMSVVGVKETAEEKKKNEKGVDPMRASGVALTGAQNTLSSWSQRKAPDPETDGVLTAEEVGALRLDGTWMVVLSACETGVGEARSGEGVFGLRRAFMIAGAENLLMTLWPVADETTAKIMADFYKEAFATGDAAGSLAKVQRDWLVKLRQERGLLAAIREAGPFAMVVMTAPSVKSFTQAEVSTPESKTPVNSDDQK
jgi:CHAT domain-containing protein/tetratricopeptide (TPR) repeat protein